LKITQQWCKLLGYLYQRAPHPQGNQELLVVRDKVGPSGKLGVRKSIVCNM